MYLQRVLNSTLTPFDDERCHEIILKVNLGIKIFQKLHWSTFISTFSSIRE